MKLSAKLIMVLGAIALAGCTNPGGLGGLGANAGANAGAEVTDPLSDTSSVAYFQAAVGDRVLFEVDQSTLTTNGRAVLDAQAAWLLSNADYTAIVEGHSDEQGGRLYNIALGNRRADAARSYLVSKGVPSQRLQIVSYGKERPIEVCSEEACYAKNRRAVTILANGLAG